MGILDWVSLCDAGRVARTLVLLAAALCLASCGERRERSGVNPAVSAAAYSAEPALAAADLARGELLSYACRACHALTPGEPSPAGPTLAGVFGRRAAAVEGFDYSLALRESELVWTPVVLDEWLARPADYLPGNDMAFTGFRSAADRRDLIAYLLEVTSTGE